MVDNTQVTITLVVAADLNDDGFPDVVAVLNDASAVAVLYGNGNGTFNPPGVLPKGDPASGYYLAAGSSPSSAAVADLNGDGKLDLVVTNYNDSTGGVFLNLGNGQFGDAPGQPFAVSNVAPNFPHGAFPSYVTLADFNGDGVPDLAIASWGRGGGMAPGSNVSILLGKGDGTFQAPATIFTDHFELAAGLAEQFTATGIYAGNVRQDLTAQVTWGSATETVATVSAGGLASTLAAGSSTISATLGGVSGSTLLTAAPPGACDIDGNGLQGVADVPSAISQALGMAPSSGGANVASVQVVLNATLSLGCMAH